MAFEALICFILASSISFVGSLQPGPVNLKVISTSFYVSYRSAMLVATGGALSEILYSLAALWFSYLLMSHEVFFGILRAATFIFLLGSGIVLLLRKRELRQINQPGTGSLITGGFLAGMFNPMLFTFWIMVMNYLVSGGIVELHIMENAIAFVAGAAAGAWVLLLIFAWITRRHRELLNKALSGKLDKLIGGIFIILAVVELYRWLH